jgi:hypothetical protein
MCIYLKDRCIHSFFFTAVSSQNKLNICILYKVVVFIRPVSKLQSFERHFLLINSLVYKSWPIPRICFFSRIFGYTKQNKSIPNQINQKLFFWLLFKYSPKTWNWILIRPPNQIAYIFNFFESNKTNYPILGSIFNAKVIKTKQALKCKPQCEKPGLINSYIFNDFLYFTLSWELILQFLFILFMFTIISLIKMQVFRKIAHIFYA